MVRCVDTRWRFDRFAEWKQERAHAAARDFIWSRKELPDDVALHRSPPVQLQQSIFDG